VSTDHFGEYGIHALEDLAAVKLVVAQAVEEGGLLVLNADDDQLVALGPLQACALGWFSLEDDHPLLQAHRRLEGATCGLWQGHLRLSQLGEVHDLGEVAAMPLSIEGRAAYNISNLAAAALAAGALGVPPRVIAEVLRSFGSVPKDNPGRLERWQVGGIQVYLDYAHNPEGLDGLLQVAVAGRPARLGLLLGQAGNREEAAIRELAAMAARHAPDLVILKDLEGYLRGRVPGEVPDILRAELLGCGLPGECLRTILSEEAAVLALLAWASTGDVLVLPVHGVEAKQTLRSLLNHLVAIGWRAGDPVA
jgi:UDP-N-acetylmuramyl tripeptide synthase